MKKPTTLDEAFEMICREMEGVFVKKHKDYGKGNILDTGELGIAFRISDKMNRLKNLMATGTKPQNETIEETWTDIGVYAVIALMYRRGWFQKLTLKKK
jgi:hypothetical protein